VHQAAAAHVQTGPQWSRAQRGYARRVRKVSYVSAAGSASQFLPSMELNTEQESAMVASWEPE